MKFKKDSRTVCLFVRAVFALLVARIAMPLQPKIKASDSVVRLTVYGHQLSGNLLVFMRWLEKNSVPLECRFLSVDKAYFKKLKREGFSVLCAQDISDMIWVLKSDVFMTDHGPGFYRMLKMVQPKIRFVDVWHGVGFKGFEVNELAKVFKRYDRIFCSSQWVKENLYIKQGLCMSRIELTGCAASDELLFERPALSAILHKFELPATTRRIVLYAPTWSHGKAAKKGELHTAHVIDVLEKMSTLPNTIFVVRLHLNSSIGTCRTSSRLHYRPMEEFPDTLSLMRASDVLITDWSSIATDYLVLNRPIVFIDTPDPFAHRHLLMPEDRVGRIVRCEEELTSSLLQALDRPERFLSDHCRKRADTLSRAYGNSLDGKSCERYAYAIKSMLGGSKILNLSSR